MIFSIFGHFKILSKCYHMTKSSFTCFWGISYYPRIIRAVLHKTRSTIGQNCFWSSIVLGDSMKNRKIQENFHRKLSILDFLSFVFQSRSSSIPVRTFWATTDQSMVLNFSTQIWTKNLLIARKNRPTRAAGYTVHPRKHVDALFKEIRVKKIVPKSLNLSQSIQ